MPQLQDLTTQQLIFAVCLFGAVTMTAYLVVAALIGANRDPLRERLQAGRGRRSVPLGEDDEAAATLRVSSISPTVQRITRAVAQPLMPKDRAEVSRLRRRFAHAGIYSTTAIHIFIVMKILLCLIG